MIPLTNKSAKSASKAFINRRTIKFYLALVRGYVVQDHIHIRNKIGADSRDDWKGIKMCSDDKDYCDKPRDSETKLIVLSRGKFDGEVASKILLKPITGRRHQLRVHCDSIGHRIVGDFTYSDRTDTKPERMFLHAQRLILPNNVEAGLDIRTEDPFDDPEVKGNLYQAEEIVCSSLEEGYEIFDKVANWFEAR